MYTPSSREVPLLCACIRRQCPRATIRRPMPSLETRSSLAPRRSAGSRRSPFSLSSQVPDGASLAPRPSLEPRRSAGTCPRACLACLMRLAPDPWPRTEQAARCMLRLTPGRLPFEHRAWHAPSMPSVYEHLGEVPSGVCTWARCLFRPRSLNRALRASRPGMR